MIAEQCARILTPAEVEDALDLIGVACDAAGCGADELSALVASHEVLRDGRRAAQGNPGRPKRLFSVGERFGRWAVLGEGKPSARGLRRICCVCDCGAVGEPFAMHLVRAQSMGCRACADARNARRMKDDPPARGIVRSTHR